MVVKKTKSCKNGLGLHDMPEMSTIDPLIFYDLQGAAITYIAHFLAPAFVFIAFSG